MIYLATYVISQVRDYSEAQLVGALGIAFVFAIYIEILSFIPHLAVVSIVNVALEYFIKKISAARKVFMMLLVSGAIFALEFLIGCQLFDLALCSSGLPY